ncbi:MAG: ParA family protein [Deltaproteobacteria bacterium]|nr:ParA family protein [Deltaproteobacteria bacterium]
MAHIICIANQKGGVGKTTSAINLSAALAMAGKKTLIVDCDAQANATTGLGIDKSALDATLYNGLIGDTEIKDIYIRTEIPNLWIVPSTVELIGFEVEMVTNRERENILARLLSPVADEFEFILIDCPPSLSLLTLNAMTAAKSVLIPLQSEFYALEGLGQLLGTIKRVKQHLNPDLKIEGILLTLYDKRTNLAGQVADDASKYFADLVFSTRIPRTVRLAEAPSFGKPIFSYDPASPGAAAYLALAKEILSNHRGKKAKG